MANPESAKEAGKCTILLMSIQPGTVEEDLIAAITRLYRSRSAAEIEQLLKKLPAVLTQSATEEIARKVCGFLHNKGAVLKVTRTAPGRAANANAAAIPEPAEHAGKSKAAPAAVMNRSTPSAPVKPRESSTSDETAAVERRARPRVHPGIHIHPMGVGGILDHSFRLLRGNFSLLFFIVFIPQVVFLVLNQGGILLLGGLDIRPTPGMGIGFGLSAVIAFIVFLIMQFWAQGALIHAVSENYLGHSTSVRSSYGAVRKRLARLIGTLILLGILVLVVPAVVGIIAAIAVPILVKTGSQGPLMGVMGVIVTLLLIWFTIRLFLNWFLADKVVILEDLGWMTALKRSRELMNSKTEKGFWKRPKNKAGLIVALGFLIGIGINLLFQLPGMGLSYVLPGFFAGSVSALLNIVASSLATVYTATGLILFYYDIRLRLEGFDLKMMAQGLG